MPAAARTRKATAEAAAPTAPVAAPAAEPPAFLADYRPVPRQRARHDGWTAERQRAFLTVLAETGCISEACGEAGVSSRSAYRLRQLPHAKDFADAWDTALRLATVRLVATAYERALRGTVREHWREGELVATTRAPSDRLLTFLLGHLLPSANTPSRLDAFDASVATVRDGFPARLARLVDEPVEMVPVESRDFFPAAPGDPREDW